MVYPPRQADPVSIHPLPPKVKGAALRDQPTRNETGMTGFRPVGHVPGHSRLRTFGLAMGEPSRLAHAVPSALSVGLNP